jgi:hypothetical protein
MAVLPKEVIDNILQGLQGIEEVKMLLVRRGQEEESSQWVSSVEARKMLKISQKTWQTYRDQRVIPFSQRGRKIYVRRADLEAYMEAHYVGGAKKSK